jgi:hypothetical protein
MRWATAMVSRQYFIFLRGWKCSLKLRSALPMGGGVQGAEDTSAQNPSGKPRLLVVFSQNKG